LKTLLAACALSLLCLPQLATAQGNLVVNGGFGTSAAGWMLTGAVYNGYSGDPAGSLALTALTASASQTINGLAPGATYSISGDYQGNGEPTPNPTFEVLMNNTIVFEAVAAGNANWYPFDFFYTASSSSVVLSFDSITPADGTKTGYSIDNISMTAVPEPSVWILSLLGGCVLFYSQARKTGGSVN
jgi:hypothetical protein